MHQHARIEAQSETLGSQGWVVGVFFIKMAKVGVTETFTAAYKLDFSKLFVQKCTLINHFAAASQHQRYLGSLGKSKNKRKTPNKMREKLQKVSSVVFPFFV